MGENKWFFVDYMIEVINSKYDNYSIIWKKFIDVLTNNNYLNKNLDYKMRPPNLIDELICFYV